MQMLQKKIIICWNISLAIALRADIFIAYIALNLISTFLRQFYPADVTNFAAVPSLVPSSSSSSSVSSSSSSSWSYSSTLLSWIDDSAKFLHCCDRPGCCSSWDISSMTTILDRIFFPLPLFPQTFSTLTCCKKFMECLVQWNIGTFLGNCSWVFPRNFFAIQCVIVTVKRFTVKVK